jgi:thiamine biosynthesis lipoprotein
LRAQRRTIESAKVQQNLTRRRFIRITAIAAPAMLLPGAVPIATEDASRLRQWHGVALGADASLQVFHPDRTVADRLIAASLDEVRRLERVFSLYRVDSALVRLNRDGHLDAPPPELVELLSICSQFSRITSGAFDITVQPLWELYAAHFSQPDADPAGPGTAAIAAARAHVGHDAVRFDADAIRFAKPNVTVTLNGIAQGYITDRVADLLRAAGCRHTLVDMGEIRALDDHYTGRPWRVGLKNPRNANRLLGVVPLRNAAIATSSGLGTPFDATGRFNHIFDPSTGACASRYLSVSVKTARATTADALSTAFSVMPIDKARYALAEVGTGEAWFEAPNGMVTSFRSTTTYS